MSDLQTEPYQPTPNTTKPKRRGGLVTGLLVVVLGGVVLAAAIWYAGGTDALAQLGGLVSSIMSPAGGSSGAQRPTPVSPSATATTTATTITAGSTSSLPPEAQQRMFAEQVASREALTALVDGNIVSLETRTIRQQEGTATVGVSATFKGGATMSGTLMLKRFNGAWYFFSLTRASDTTTETAAEIPDAFDSAVVATISDQQAQPATQEMLAKGLLGGGYRDLDVESVTMGPRSATINVAMSGGTLPSAKGRLVCISKSDSGTTYWFVARFEKR